MRARYGATVEMTAMKEKKHAAVMTGIAAVAMARWNKKMPPLTGIDNFTLLNAYPQRRDEYEAHPMPQSVRRYPA
jgi:hypothetical protein